MTVKEPACSLSIHPARRLSVKLMSFGRAGIRRRLCSWHRPQHLCDRCQPENPLPGGVLATALSAMGCTYASGNNTIILPRNNQVIDGWDLSLHGGLGLQVNGCNNTISNCKFALGSNSSDTQTGLGPGAFVATQSSTTNITITKCDMTAMA